MARQRIGELLVQQGSIDVVQLQSALAHQARWGGRLGRALVQLGFVPERTVLEAVGGQVGAAYVEIGDRVVPRDVLALLPAKLVRSRRVLPLERVAGLHGALVVAVANPGDLSLLDDVAFAAGLPVKAVIASEDDLDRAIARHLDGAAARAPTGFAHREDAIPLEDAPATIPLLRDPQGGPGKHRLH